VRIGAPARDRACAPRSRARAAIRSGPERAGGRPIASHAIVVGAGPAGALLAYLLARRGLAVTLFERSRDFAREFRGEVLMPSGLEALDQTGLWAEVEGVPHVVLRAFEFYVDGVRRARQELPVEVFGRHRPRWMSQPALLEMLVAQAGRFPGFRLLRGATVRALLESEGRVRGVRALGPEGVEMELGAELVVGADGRSSTVRRRAGFAERADRLPMDVVWFRLPRPAFLAADEPFRFYAGNGQLLLAAPVYGGELQIGWVIAKGAYGDLRQRGLPEWIDRMAAHVSPDLAGHLRRHRGDATHPFLLSTVSDRVLSWSRPGVLLLGDAAHTMSPVGAQGINLAIRDALAAANELVPVLGAGAEPAALDAACRRVEEARAPEVREIQRLQSFPPRILLSSAWWARLALRILPRVLASDLARARQGAVFRRFAFGTSDVRLRV
jgi:2-polyprenyl-6-methoxyphenol hydroxylase-like FAD-dependent oxidoreductase